jgi:diguanylate cyclase (GGDEF)-like protein
MFAKRMVVAISLLYAMAPGRCGVPSDTFARDLAAARADAQLMPRAALRRLDSLEVQRRGSDQGQVLVETSLAYSRLGDKDKALDAAAQATSIGQNYQDDALLATAMLARAHVFSSLVHDLDSARDLIAQAGQVAAKTHDGAVRTQVLVARAQLAELEGRAPDGLRTVIEAVASARAAAGRGVLAPALRVQARLYATDGQQARALASIDEVIAIAQASKSRVQMAQARLAEYAVASQLGNVKRAEKALQTAVDLLEEIDAKEGLVTPLANLAELYTQQMRYGEAARASESALRIAQGLDDARGAHLASFQLGIASIHFRDIAAGRRMVETALSALQDDDRYLPMLLEYGYALGKVGEGDGALTMYRKASAVSRADWRRGQQLSYVALQRAFDNERKQSEVAALHHDAQLKAAELHTEHQQKSAWVQLSALALVAMIVIGFMYRRIASANRLLRLKNDQLFHQSTRDSLTGLFNRHYFYEHVVPTRLGRPGGVFLLMDIDRFKSVNDTYGHGAGDVVLKSVAARLNSTLREQDVLVRWGGEEFLAYLPDVPTAEVRRVCARLLAAVATMPIAIDGHELVVTTSIGFCPHPAGSGKMGWERLVHLADLCLYLAKTAGRNQAFGIDDASALTPDVLAAADSDLRQASTDGLVSLVNVKTAPAPAPAQPTNG